MLVGMTPIDKAYWLLIVGLVLMVTAVLVSAALQSALAFLALYGVAALVVAWAIDILHKNRPMATRPERR